MSRLGQNKGGYFGERIDIDSVLSSTLRAAQAQGWQIETIPVDSKLNLHALIRRDPAPAKNAKNVYLSTGIHGDEPAGPLAVQRLLEENRWPSPINLFLCPCLNPTGFPLNRRENAAGMDLNRDYLHVQTPEVGAHIRWLERQPDFDLSLCLHEDWESHGFYVYELNSDRKPSLAEEMIRQVESVCPIDRSPTIEGRLAREGIISPDLATLDLPQWPEALYLIHRKTRLSYTLEAPSDFPLSIRVEALVTGVRSALDQMAATAL